MDFDSVKYKEEESRFIILYSCVDTFSMIFQEVIPDMVGDKSQRIIIINILESSTSY